MEKLLSEFNLPLTFGKLLDLHTKISKSKTLTLKNFSEAIGCNDNFLRQQISNIKQESKRLRGESKSEYLKTVLKLERQHKPEPKPSSSVQLTEVETLREIVEDLKNSAKKHEEDRVTLTEVQKENKKLQQNMKSLQLKFSQKQSSLKTLKAKQKILVRSLSRKSLKLHKQIKVSSDLQKNVKTLRKAIKYVDKKRRAFEEENTKLKETLKEKEDFAIDTSEDNNEAALKKEISDLKESLSYTENIIEDNLSKVVETTDSEKNAYTTDTQICIMNLISEGVGVHHVNTVMHHVATLCGKTLSKLPSVSTINRIGDQRASVSYMHMDEKLRSKEHTTLQSDETRKHGDVYEVFSVRDGDQKEWILGLKEMKDKSSETCLSTLTQVIQDISECTTTETGKQILTNIKNTMSDRAATEKKFHQLLKDYREEILPSVYSGWEELSIEEKESITTMNNFYCGLHILVNFAEVSDGIIRDFEFNLKGEESVGAEAQPETKQFTEKGESGTVRLVRTACKCLARGGDEKSGCYSDFKTFLTSKYGLSGKKTSKLLVPFRGNRFNILFYNAEIVLLLSDDIKEYFEKVNKPSNRLQKAVFYDIKVELYLAILKALGLCSKLVTAPFWRIMEDKECSLEEASKVYQKLNQFLDTAKEDSSELLSGDSPLPLLVKKDEVYERLTTPNEYDAKTIIVLQQILGAWSTLLQKAASEHLPGGKFAEVDRALASQTVSTPRHNKFPERVFALLDALTRYRPVASTLCNEAYIMFSLNKTGEWINSLSTEKKQLYLDKARKEGREIRRKYLERVKSLEEAQKEALKRKRAAVEKKEQNQFRVKENLTNDMLFYGLWQFPEVVDQRLKGIQSDSEKRKALKTQLQFRKIVLEQKGDKKLFQMSEKGKAYSMEKLVENVKSLIRDSVRSDNDSYGNILVGRRIVHYQMVEDQRTPFNGRVISTVPGFSDWCNVIYDGDEAVYAYKLIEDYAAGDLEIIVKELEELEPPEKRPRTTPSCSTNVK